MKEQKQAKFTKIVFCLVIGTLLFTFHSCRRNQSTIDQSESLRISSIDNYPSWSPDGTRISFHSHRDNNREVYVMNADGSNQTRLTDNPASDAGASWSPDGQKIAFVSDRDGNFEIYTMNADGSNQTRITDNPSSDRFPSWSPDTSRIVFHTNRDKNRDIYTMNADGSGLSRLTDNPAADTLPSWSPDGSRIAFVSHRDENPEIYIMDADGSNQTRLTINSTMDIMPSWSPDGSRIVFVSGRDENPEIYVMNADGSDQVRLTDEPAQDIYPSWSPDGLKIAFGSDRYFDNEVCVMNVDGSNQVNLTRNAPLNTSFRSVPLPQSELDLDGIQYKIVFESYRETDGKENWELCLIDSDGSNQINLTNTTEIDEMYPHASPDGSLVCFVADEGEDEESKSRNVYYMNIGGTERVKIAENAYQPCWSPDGKYIAYLPGEYPRYDRNMWANKGLEIYDLETGEVRRHPNDDLSHLFNLCWSPDGKWFTAAGRRSPNIAFKVDDLTLMTMLARGCRPEISPDGKEIVWHGTDWSIHMGQLDFDSPDENVTEHTIVVACDREHEIYHVDWSPDGNYLTFSYWPNDGKENVSFPAPGSNICICDLKTGIWTQITTDGKHNKEPDWVPVREQ
jgi:Tol biopolymer transport system component